MSIQPLISIEWDADGALAALDRIIDGLANPRPLMQDVADELKVEIGRRFQTKTDPEGNAWAPISEATKQIYQSDWFIKRNPAFKGGIPGSLLQRTNALRGSLTHNINEDGVEVGFARATAGGKWEVAMLHEFGTAKMPRRGLMTADPKTGKLGADDEALVLAAVNGYLEGLF
jgi:phage virion morphogenesis protein